MKPDHLSPLLSSSKTPANGKDRSTSTPIPYTGSPLLLVFSDLILLLRNAWSIPGILIPITTDSSTPLDELYPSSQNFLSLFLHGVLLLFEGTFLLTLPVVIALPVWMVLLYGVGVWLVVWVVSRGLNGKGEEMWSNVDLGDEQHEGECWIFVNGVAVGYAFFPTSIHHFTFIS